jgi:hypothetical protein
MVWSGSLWLRIGTTLLWHTNQCSQWLSSPRSLVAASNSRSSSAPRLTPSQAGGHLTPTSYSCNCHLAGPRQRSDSRVRVPRHSWAYCTLSDSRLPQHGGPGPRIHIAQEQGGPVIPPGTSFPFRRHPRLGTDRKENTASIVFLRKNMSPELFLSNGCCAVACLHRCHLSMGLYVTILSYRNVQVFQIFYFLHVSH